MKEKQKKQEETKIVVGCNDCWKHGSLKVRGRNFKGYVIKKFPKRIVIEFERVVYIPKYERYLKKKTKIHARLPECMHEEVGVGDYVLVGECRPLSKITHFVYLQVIRKSGVKEKQK
jgi:small subunit ribosomal protein S17